MAQVALFESYQGSRLVRELNELIDVRVPLSHKNFALKLGELIDLSDSFELSDHLRSLPRLKCKPDETLDATQIQQAFIEWQADTVKGIIHCFNEPNPNRPLHRPVLTQERFEQPTTAWEAYQRFYALHQSEMDAKILRLRQQIREAANAHSDKLRQLATLDSALADTLMAHTRKTLAIIPSLMGKRFQQLLKLHQKALAKHQQDDSLDAWQAPDSWLNQFHRELQSVMLAELELRLLPVIGLLEAMEHED